MEVEVTQENLAHALLNTSRVSSSRSGLPILNNILIRTTNNQLLIAATNLEIATTQTIGAKIVKQGSLTVPAKLITEFVQNLPKEKIKITTKQNSINITCGNYTSTINGTQDDEFPELPGIDEKHAVKYTINAAEFKQAIQQTIIAASGDATRPVLTGVYWHTTEGRLYFAATDGYRLAEKRMMKVSSTIAAIVPVDALQEVLRSITDTTESVEVLFDEVQVRFRLNDGEITSKLIDGNFPDYQQLIPKNSETSATINKSELSRVVKVTSLFAKGSGGAITVESDESNNTIVIHSIASEVGENSSSIIVDTLSGSGSVTLNARYISDALSVIDSETITLAYSNGIAPTVITPFGDKDKTYTHIIMPIKN